MKPTTPKARVTFLCVLFLGFFLLFSLRLVKMQVVEYEQYAELASRSSEQEQTVAAARGEIVDRYGRPMATNRTGFNVVFDRAFLPRGKENEIIFRLFGILNEMHETWYDELPIEKTAPYAFLENHESDISRLKRLVDVADYTTANDVMGWLVQRYKLEAYSVEAQRLIAGVRYQMEQRGFSVEIPYTFAEDISISTVTKIKENSYEMPGVDVQESAIREYSCGTIAPHVVGRIGPIFAEELKEYTEKGYSRNDIVGKEGIEKAFEEELRGESGERRITMKNGSVVEAVVTKEPKPGNTVVLTIDKEMQKAAQLALEKQIKNLQQTAKAGKGREADVGAAVVIDVPTGEILALATYPSFDMSTYGEDYNKNIQNPLKPLYNRALQGTYAPGSTFKPCVATGGLNEGLITRDYKVMCNHVYTLFQDYQPTCMYRNGLINVVDALRVSCNIFFYDTGWRLGIDKIEEYAKGYGLGEPTGIELPEALGRRASPEYAKSQGAEWYPGNVLQAAIGQSDNKFTPLQIANYTATIANGGVRMETHVVKSVMSYDFNQTVRETQPKVAYDMKLKDGVIDIVKEGMIAAAGPSGTSYVFNNYPITVAAKTGTPQTSTEKINSTYIAFAPAEKPQIAVAIVIENGGQGYTGAPVAKEIFDQYFFSNQGTVGPQTVETLLP